eukprot:2053870-Prymnesium_polylepis.1
MPLSRWPSPKVPAAPSSCAPSAALPPDGCRRQPPLPPASLPPALPLARPPVPTDSSPIPCRRACARAGRHDEAADRARRAIARVGACRGGSDRRAAGHHPARARDPNPA